MSKRYQCPKCGGKSFTAIAHVTQEWMIDGNGNFVESISACIDVTHKPDDEDLWECLDCGYATAGSEFRDKGDEL